MIRPPALIRSGWWVAVAGIAIAALVLWLALRGPVGNSRNALGDGRDPASYGFDLSISLIPVESIVAAGMPRDGVPALDRPAMISAADVAQRNHEGRGKFLLAADRVVGVEVAGQTRAYPIRFMRWHEVVNDVVADRPILVTYNPLCDAAVVFDREIGNEVFSFGVSGLVHNSNPLLYDRQAEPAASSLWSQLDGGAMAGPAAARELSLALRPSSLTTWETWSQRHPETTVLAPLDRLKTVYKRDPYHSYFGSDLLRFPVEPLPPPGDLALKDRVLIVTVDGQDTVFSLDRIAAAQASDFGAWTTTVADVEVTIHYNAVLGAADVDWPDGVDRRVSSRQACWFAWYSHHPNTPPPLPPVQSPKSKV